MSDVLFDPARRARRVLVALAVSALIAAAATIALAVHLTDTAAGQPRPVSPSPTRAAQLPTEEVTWVEVAGVWLPVSQTHGPRITDHGRAAGYSHSPQGAALAAVQVLARTSSGAGPAVYQPILTSQVIGANTAALATTLDDDYEQLRHRLGDSVWDGDPLPGNDATVAGYLVSGYDTAAATALVQVLLTAPTLPPGQLVDVAVSLLWADGDWRVVAPPDGDWGTVTTTVTGPPKGMLDYGQVR